MSGCPLDTQPSKIIIQEIQFFWVISQDVNFKHIIEYFHLNIIYHM